MLPGQHAGKFHLPDLPVQVRQQTTDFCQGLLVVALLTEFDENLSIIQPSADGITVLNQLVQECALLQDLLGFLVVIPEFRPGDLGFQLCNPLTLGIDVKGTSSAR